jgi:hypothetical protein
MMEQLSLFESVAVGRGMHVNSREAYHDPENRRMMGERARAILACLRGRGAPMSDAEIREAMGLKDMNDVRPRITELKKLGAICEVERVRDPRTGKTVRRVSVVQ